jgi:hypothetical protein
MSKINPIVSFLMCAPFIEVNICLLAHQIGVPPTNSLDFRQGVHDFPLPVHIGVKQTQDMLLSDISHIRHLGATCITISTPGIVDDPPEGPATLLRKWALDFSVVIALRLAAVQFIPTPSFRA